MNDAMLPRYGQAPVIEVVAGIEFASQDAEFSALAVAVANEFAGELSPAGFADPIPPSQRFSVVAPFQPFFRMGIGPAPLRLLLESTDSVWLLQVQDNRIVVNWRKAHLETVYPGYLEMKSRLSDYVNRVSQLRLVRPLSSRATEFTYVNAVPGGLDSAAETFSVISAPAFEAMPGQPIATRFQIIRDVPEKSAQVSVSSEPRDVAGEFSSILTITSNVFNVAGATVHDAMLSLDDAHRISRKTFTAVTTESMRKTWGEEAHEHR